MAYWDGERWLDERVPETRQASRARRVFDHSWKALLEGALISLLVVGLIAGTAFAGKGGKTASTSAGSLTMVPMDGATEAHFGARVTFTISQSATPYPFVLLKCYQGGKLVLQARQGFFGTALGHPWIYLGPTTYWQSGAGDCTATLQLSTKQGWSSYGTATSFHVYD